MPIVFPPNDDVLIALGKMALQFAELEYWVYVGIIEAEHITDPAKRAKVRKQLFSRRVDRLKAAFAKVEDSGLIRFGQNFLPAVDFVPSLKTVASERNDFLHDATFSLINKGVPYEVHHLKVNAKTGAYRALDKTTLDQLTARVADYAERLQAAVGGLCLAKEAKGIEPLTGGTFKARKPGTGIA